MPAATDDFGTFRTSLDSPARKAFAITTHDTNELSHVTRGISVNVAGDLNMVFVDDSVAVTVTVVAGQVYPYQLKLVKTATTATGIVGYY